MDSVVTIRVRVTRQPNRAGLRAASWMILALAKLYGIKATRVTWPVQSAEEVVERELEELKEHP